MRIKIEAYGKGLASILAVSALILVILNKSEWIIFLLFAVIIYLLSIIVVLNKN